MRLGESPKGLIASGTVTKSPSEGPHWDNGRAAAGQLALYVEVVFDYIAEASPLISLVELAEIAPDFAWTPQGSGKRIPQDIAEEIERRWSRKSHLGWAKLPDEVARPIVEGAAERVWVSRIERNPLARRLCIDHYGAICYACKLSFERVYGPVAEGYVHVHHLNPLASAAGEREVDPVRDLRPLCPNCHAVAHLRDPPFSVEEIAAMLASARDGT